MATWRCPHCRTVQAESPRCFLCLRSATSCGTCVNFRRSLVGGVGYCGLDRRRQPLTGAEQLPCWTGEAGAVPDGLFVVVTPAATPAASGDRQAQVRRPGGDRLVELEASPPVSGP